MVEAGRKRQTIRLPRKRHARPGERIQLFTGMRTARCRKLIPDPVCIGVDEVRFDLREASGCAETLPETVSLEINGVPVVGPDADLYAGSDGFTGRRGVGPFAHMALWWHRVHGRVLFEGVAIRWETRP